MNVNNIYSDIVEFWDKIYPIILFHLIFFLLYRFIFGNFSLKDKLENYINSTSFERTKNILEKFELWTKLPIIILVSTLAYLALFSSATNFISSVRIFPFNFSYSNDEFMREYAIKEDLVEMAKFSNDTSGNYETIEQLRTKYLEEYKAKHPDKYESWVGWLDKSFVNSLRYFHLFECLLMLILITYFIQIKKAKINVTFKLLFVLLISIPLLFILRFRAEQNVEEKFMAEMMFIKNELRTDNNIKIVWSQQQIETTKRKLDDYELNKYFSTDIFWLSRHVQRNKILKSLFGHRKIPTRNLN